MIEAGWLTPFYAGWRREVVYRRARPTTCEVYYWSPDGAKLRSGRMAEDYFATKPTNPHLGPMQLCLERRPLGLNNLRYEVVRRAKPQKIHPTPVYSHRDDPPQTRFRVPLRTPLTTFHDQPGDISSGSWGRLKPLEPEGDDSQRDDPPQTRFRVPL